jgi:hypothetical protein
VPRSVVARLGISNVAPQGRHCHTSSTAKAVTNTISRAPQTGHVGGMSVASGVDMGAPSYADCLAFRAFQTCEPGIEPEDFRFQPSETHRQLHDLATRVLVFLPRDIERATRQGAERAGRATHPARDSVAHDRIRSRRRASDAGAA